MLKRADDALDRATRSEIAAYTLMVESKDGIPMVDWDKVQILEWTPDNGAAPTAHPTDSVDLCPADTLTTDAPPLAVQAQRLFSRWEMVREPARILANWLSESRLLTVVLECQPDRDFGVLMTVLDPSGTVHLTIPQWVYPATGAIPKDFSLDRKSLIGRDVLVIGRDGVFHAGFLGKTINVGNQSITVNPGPVYWSQQRTYHRYTVNPPIKVGLREVHESAPSIFVRLVDISMGGAAFIADIPGTSINPAQGAGLPFLGQLFWAMLPRPECGDSLNLAATFVNQRQIPGSSTVLWAFAWQQVTIFSDLEAWIAERNT
ncbi:type IV pilus assembly PilZ [Acidithiobacillus ferrivorans SS3]|uniref:Type IV pilus assembly PilZ n=2 Tax=Acidithiobacillus ferrivorans TaxID=160808 RepID=G0JSC1_9PROT|nr:PilZ domain-containing protein [Acidithiobacillus ferrivorans]AEM47718.1 type IV pilus assembly PilZ [Acidithiobacillus ferrivorans SS3]MBU2850945.1 PilZ domain-containing protein [Acidithiobacillus ferrivorans]OFA16492.1 hypothetical protein A4U49_07160 [Acidithiobacillus ferrivorans]